MSKNFLTISIKNAETAYYYAAYLLHSNALLITTPNNFIVPFPLIKKSKIIISTFIDLDILDLLEPFTILFDIDISPFMLKFIKTYCEQEKIKIVYFTKAESKFFIDDYINVNGKYLFDDDYNLIEYKE